MRIAKTAFGLFGMTVTITASAIPTINTKAAIKGRDVTTHGNFSDWCDNITAYGSSTSTIQAWCGQGSAGDIVQYISHIDLDLCLTNINGEISGATNGNAMHSCQLGPSGRNACSNCNGAWFDFTCKAGAGEPDKTSTVNLDDYIGLEQTTNAAGEAVWVLSCSTTTMNIGQFDGCSKLGATDPSC